MKTSRPAFRILGPLLLVPLLFGCSAGARTSGDPPPAPQDRDAAPVPSPENAPNRTILLTGFEPFGGGERNASWEGVRLLDGEVLGDHRIAVLRLPVVWGAPLPALREAVGRLDPCAVFSFGQGYRGRISFESVAENRRGGHLDNAGNPPPAPEIVPGGPLELTSDFPFREVMERYRGPSLSVLESREAGNYLCEECLYSIETLRAEIPGRPAVAFFHVPPLGSELRCGERRVPCSPEVLRDFVKAVVLAWISHVREGAGGPAGAPRSAR